MDLDAARTDLEQVVRESEAAIASLVAEEAEEAESGDQQPADSADDAADLTENDREEALVDAAIARREEARAALARLDAGTYGICVDCGDLIVEARLAYRPEAARCLSCQQAFEEREG